MGEARDSSPPTGETQSAPLPVGESETPDNPPPDATLPMATGRGRNSTIGDARLNAALAKRIRAAGRGGGNLHLLVSHGYGLGDAEPAESMESQASPAKELLSLSDSDIGQIAVDIVSAVAANHTEAVTAARVDEDWDTHLGEKIREAWTDFQACVGVSEASDRHFRAALNRILAEGRTVF